MSRFHAGNVALVTLRMKEFAEKEAKREVLRRMRRIAVAMVDFIDSRFSDDSNEFPQYTANLHDATGIAIYDNGKLESYMPAQRASVPQENSSREEEWGSQELANVIRQGMSRFSKGLWLVLFSASSYAEQVEDLGSPRNRGKKFFEWLWDQISIDIKDEFEGCIVAPLFGLSDALNF